MTQWEYAEYVVEEDYVSVVCNRRGLDGWELSGIFTAQHFSSVLIHLIFKRPLNEKKNDHTPTDRPPNM